MKQLGVLLACCVGGSLLSLLLRGLLPGNVLGLTLLLALLIFGAVRLHHVESVADFLLQNMAFFFLPAMLGVLEIWNADQTRSTCHPCRLPADHAVYCRCYRTDRTYRVPYCSTVKPRRRSTMTDLLSSSQFWLLVSIGFYALGVEIQKKTGSAVCNPLLIASILVGALLIATGTPYQTYEESGKLISFFLTPATVALAIPIYRKLDVLLKNLLPILLGAFVGSMVSIGSVLLFSHLFGLSESTTLSLVPKSVTTPIAVAVAEMLGGVTSITAIAVVITGIIGAIILPTFLKCIGVRNPVQMGLSIGTASHAVGTSRAIELGETEGAISGLAIGVAGLLTALIVSIGSAILL